MIINLNNLGGGGGGSTVAWNQIVTGGTEIANININGVQQQVYAPESKDYAFYVDNWNQTDWANFYTLFSGLTTEEKFKVTLLFGQSGGFGNFMACKYFQKSGNDFKFQGSDTADDNNNGGRIIPNRLKYFYLKSNGTISNTVTKFSNVVQLYVNYESQTISLENCSYMNLNRSFNGGGFSVIAYLRKNYQIVSIATVQGSSEMSGNTRFHKIVMDWEYDGNKIHSEYKLTDDNTTLLKWEETPIGSGECNYQIVDALSAVTNPQEGTRAYVKEKYVTETWSGWTFDCNGEEAEQSGMIATFTKGGNELAKLYHSYGDFYWDWNQDGEWHRNTDYAYKTVGYSKIFQIVFPNISDVTLYLHDSKTATATTSYSFTYLSPFNSYIYTPSDTWKVENKLFDINYMNRQLLIDFYNYFSGLTDYDKYNITLINSNEKLSYRYLYKTDDDRFYFQGSDTYFDNSIGGIEKNRSSQIYISQSGDIEMSTWSFGCNGAVRVDYVSSAHTVEDVTCGGSAYAWEKILENPRNADYTAMLYSGDTNIASTSIKFTRVVSGGTTYLGAIMDWVYDGKNIHAEYIIEKFDTTTLLKWEETPITTLKLGNTTLSETQLQALIALIPS